MWGFEEIFRFLMDDKDDYEQRLVKNSKEGEYTIDTAYCNDTMLYETGIKKNDGIWIIVEQYGTKEKAQLGHAKWETFASLNPTEAYDVLLEETRSFDEEDIWS